MIPRVTAHLDNEPAARSEVSGCIPEHVGLFDLRRDVHDAVPHEVHQREVAWHGGRHHVSNGYGYGVSAGVVPQLIGHVR